MTSTTKARTVEQQVIDQLTEYRDISGRIKVLSTYSIGSGITVSRLNEDDQLQDLHRKLRRLPSYMYLNKHEQRLEQTAHAYLSHYPAGTRAQKRAIPTQGVDAEDDKLLKEIRSKIQKVIDARGTSDDLDEVLERLTELQDLMCEKEKVDNVLDVMRESHAHLAELLCLRYIEGLSVIEVAAELGIVPRTFNRWRGIAIEKYSKLSGMS